MASFFKYFNINTEQRQQDDCLLQGQGQLDQRVVFSFFASFGEGDGVEKLKLWSEDALAILFIMFCYSYPPPPLSCRRGKGGCCGI